MLTYAGVSRRARRRRASCLSTRSMLSVEPVAAVAQVAYAHVCSRMLTYAHVAYAHVCSRMLTYAHVCSRSVCSRMLTYAHVCSRMRGVAETTSAKIR
jgi:hypothetical protein